MTTLEDLQVRKFLSDQRESQRQQAQFGPQERQGFGAQQNPPWGGFGGLATTGSIGLNQSSMTCGQNQAQYFSANSCLAQGNQGMAQSGNETGSNS